ncbi:MAG: CoB--CoM heterodisulfide reductase iron-sulfur subunit B family protein [Candidatus Bathyarchaeota archaeon]|nr:MAG: CoB--CoM heterodisulfide reductase iron-sulfur subunit B family protein [Candidatus Bathyarchaeota archaeon]
MRYAFFPGCLVQTEQYGYELSVREVMSRLGAELVDLEGASCCGYPSYSITSPLMWTYLTARNTALAERQGLDILTICNNCNLSFCENREKLEKDGVIRDTINQALSQEGLEYRGDGKVVHMLELLHDEIGLEEIAGKIVKPLNSLRLAAHPGCHSFRPSKIKRPDYAEVPGKLDELIRALGAESHDYPEKLNCCGSLISGAVKEAALKLASSKLRAVKERGVDGLVTLCPYCFKILDGEQAGMRELMRDENPGPPVFYYTQLLGLSMGLATEKLGLNLNLSPVDGLLQI